MQIEFPKENSKHRHQRAERKDKKEKSNTVVHVHHKLERVQWRKVHLKIEHRPRRNKNPFYNMFQGKNNHLMELNHCSGIYKTVISETFSSFALQKTKRNAKTPSNDAANTSHRYWELEQVEER
jgi:hypothetical protein